MNAEMLRQAVVLLRQGEVVAAPTDTVYGLLADATNESAVRKVYELKHRPAGKPLIVLVPSMDVAKGLVEFSAEAEDIAKRFWTREKLPLTIVLKAKRVSKLITAGGDTVALRLPNNALCLELMNALGKPLIAPSANISGNNTAVSLDMVRRDFGDQLPLIIDGGVCQNPPSTIIDLSTWKLKVLRQGSVKI